MNESLYLSPDRQSIASTRPGGDATPVRPSGANPDKSTGPSGPLCPPPRACYSHSMRGSPPGEGDEVFRREGLSNTYPSISEWPTLTA